MAQGRLPEGPRAPQSCLAHWPLELQPPVPFAPHMGTAGFCKMLGSRVVLGAA